MWSLLVGSTPLRDYRKSSYQRCHSVATQAPNHVLKEDVSNKASTKATELTADSITHSADWYVPLFLSDKPEVQGANLDSLPQIQKKTSHINISSFWG